MQNFSKFLGDYEGGFLDKQLGRELEKIVTAVGKQGKKGSLSVMLELKPSGNGKLDLVVSYNAKPPVDNTVKGKMWVDKENNLVAADPDQPILNNLTLVKPVETPTKREAI